jgi:3-oxoacyl-[acyl-carrier-protein] synthase-3
MLRSKIAGIGMYVPKNVVTNNDLMKYMDTSDEWIQERTGIKERRYADRTKETTATMGIEAAKIAIERAGITPQDIDFIIFATICPDYYFPGCGVLLQRAMKMKEIGIRYKINVRILYALSTGDQFIRTGMYKNILLLPVKTFFRLDLAMWKKYLRHLGDYAAACITTNNRRTRAF